MATTNPDNDNETPGTTHAATSSPIAHDPKSTTARSRICVMAISVCLGVTFSGNEIDQFRSRVSPAEQLDCKCRLLRLSRQQKQRIAPANNGGDSYCASVESAQHQRITV